MTLRTNSAEGGTNGTTVSTGNSGGTSGDAFLVVSIGGASTLTYDTTQKMHGSLSHKVGGATSTTTFFGWNGYTATTFVARFYFRFSALPGVAGFRLLDIRDSAGNGVGRVNLNVSNQLVFQNNGSTLKTFASAISANTWYRLEVVCGNNTAKYACDYYLGDSGTPVETGFLNAAQASGTTNTIAEIRYGTSASTTFASSLWIDDEGAQDGATTYLGPVGTNGSVTAVAATASVAASAPAITGEVIVTGGGPATATVLVLPPTITAGTGVFPPAATVTGLILPPTVTTTQNPTVTAVAATASVAAPVPGVAAGGTSTINAIAATTSVLALPPTVTATRSATVTGVAATATVAARPPAVTTGGLPAYRSFFEFI